MRGFESEPDPPGTPAPPQLEEAVFAGLAVRLQVDQPVLAVGDDGQAQFVLHNRGQERIGPLTHGQPLTGSLLNAGQETAGGFHGAIIGTGRTLDLAPGQSTSVGVIFGTASFRPEPGYTLPPGRYWLRVCLPFRYGRLVPGGPTHKVTAPLTEITIVPRAQPGQ